MAEAKQGWVWRHRIVVVRDQPGKLRPWRWALERVTATGTADLQYTGRARSFSGAVHKAARKAVLCPWKVERLELEMVTRDEPEPECPAPRRNPLPPELLPALSQSERSE